MKMKRESSSVKLHLLRISWVSLVCNAFLSCLLFFLNVTEAQDGQDGKGVGVKLVHQLPSREKRWALIIGVDKYEKGVSSLEGTVNDAKALKSVLVEYAGFPKDQVILLTTDASNPDQLPRRANILDELNKLSHRVPEDGLLLFSFSGHGVSIGNDAYLIPSDGRITKNLKLLRDFSIDVQRVREAIAEIKVKQVIMLLDACRNEPGRGETPNPLTEAYKLGFRFDVVNSEVKAFATLYAASIGERAFEFYDKETKQYRGYFSSAIEEGMRGKALNTNGAITLGGLINYVENTVPKRVRSDQGENQHPFKEVAGYKESELILAIGASISDSKSDHWSTSKDCLAATSSPFYYPSMIVRKQELARNEVVRGHPTGGCFDIETPDRKGGHNWVRIEAGRPLVYSRTTGVAKRLAATNGHIFGVLLFPFPDAGTGVKKNETEDTDPISGEWEIISEQEGNANNGTIFFNFKLNGRIVTCEARSTKGEKILKLRSGTWSGGILTLVFDSNTPATQITLTAILRGGNLIGDIKLDDTVVGKWVGTKRK